jgi:hypothetical protein
MTIIVAVNDDTTRPQAPIHFTALLYFVYLDILAWHTESVGYVE